MKFKECIISRYGISCLNHITKNNYLFYKNIIIKEKIIFYLILRSVEFIIKDFIYNNNITNNSIIKNSSNEIYNLISFS